MRSFISIIFYCIGFLISNFLGKFFLRGFFASSLFSSIEEEIFNKINISNNLENIYSGLVGNNFLKETVGSQILKIFTKRVVFIIIFFSIYSFFRVLKRYIFRLTKVIKKLPVIGMFDGVLGGVCGVFKAFVFLFIFAIICSILIALTQNSLYFLNTKIIDSTYLFFLFYKILHFLNWA